MSEYKDAIFSIKPEYVKLILGGQKTVEFRRVIPKYVRPGSTIYFWETSPAKRLVGYAQVTAIATGDVKNLWIAAGNRCGTDMDCFDLYFDGAAKGIAIFFANVREYDNKPMLSEMRNVLAFTPPQSFRYVTRADNIFFQLRPVLKPAKEAGCE